MAKYVDGFVLPVPKNKLEEYKKMSKVMAKLMKQYGALDYIEAAGDDLDPKMEGMKFTKFTQMAKAKPGETVMFSFIIFKSRKHRDQVNAKVMKDPLMSQENWKDTPMPFDMKRMAYGGFQAIVQL